MRFGGRRGIEALAVLFAVLIVVGVLLPLLARAATFQVKGLVSTCPNPPGLPFVPGATVTLVDVNGVRPSQTTQTGPDGSYAFNNPPPASYTITADHPQWFSASNATPVLFDGTKNVNIGVCMVAHGSPSKGLVVKVTDNANNPIPGASVSAFESASARFVTKGPTNASGQVNLTLWSTTFVLRASAANFPTVERTVDVSATSNTVIVLPPTTTDALFGHVTDSVNNSFLGGVVAWLYNPSLSRLIPATVRASLYEFEAARVPPATYTLIVDANDHLSSKELITITGTPILHDLSLARAPKERYETAVLYGTADWNNITIQRNLTLSADSTLTGLGPPDLRDLRLQIDATLGNGNGVLDPAEIAPFQAWLTAKGPAYVTTAGFFTTNGRAYNSTAGTFSLTVSPTLSTPDARVWINSTATYTIQGPVPPYIANGARQYYVNMTVVPDTDVPAYKDYVYVVQLPRTYEMNNSYTVIVPANAPVTATNFTRFTVDPAVMPAGSLPQAQMRMERSLVGIARAKAIAPPGKFAEANADYRNYQVFVAKNTEITYSAATSSHPVQPPCNLNFTWKFTGTDTRWGCEVKYTYTLNGTKTVNLTMRQGSANYSYRDFTVFVDDVPPTAVMRTNRTGSGSANGATLKVDAGIPVRFDGGLSRDLAYPGKNGTIPNAGYAWDFDQNGTVDATGRNVTWTFRKPGIFLVNLTVTDGVGLKGTNATMTVQVNDTKAPVPLFDILDPDKDWGTITSPTERKTIAFNASRSSDDHDKTSNLNFTWTIPGPVRVGGSLLIGSSHTLYGVNVTFAWDEWNSSYKVVLSVRDMGFGSNKPNWGNLTRNITVQIDVTLHADLKVDPFKINPTDPAEGDPFTISVNVTNKAGRLTASNVIVEVTAITGGVGAAVPVTSVQWFRGGVETTDMTIAPGTTVQLVITAHFTGQGNKTLRVTVRDQSEPYTWLADNHPQTGVNVRQPWWQPWAIGGAIFGIIAIAVGGMYTRRKIKAGEWRPLRGRRLRGEKGAEEKEKPRREVKEEKKRL